MESKARLLIGKRGPFLAQPYLHQWSWNRGRQCSTHMRQNEGMGRPVHHGKRIRSFSSLLCSKNAQWKGMLVGFGEVVGPNKSDQEWFLIYPVRGQVEGSSIDSLCSCERPARRSKRILHRPDRKVCLSTKKKLVHETSNSHPLLSHPYLKKKDGVYLDHRITVFRGQFSFFDLPPFTTSLASRKNGSSVEE